MAMRAEPRFTDQDLMGLILQSHKHLAESLNMCLLETANDQLRRDYQNILMETYDHHKQIWNVMNQRGWYSVRPANPQDVARAQNVLGGPPM